MTLITRPLALRLSLCATAFITVSGCLHRPACNRISDHDAASVEDLTCAASRQDKLAQLVLGIRYEEGRGVPQDLRRAEKLYAKSAKDEPQEISLWEPAGGGQKYGRVVTQSNPNYAIGQQEAKDRLKKLRERKRQMRDD